MVQAYSRASVTSTAFVYHTSKLLVFVAPREHSTSTFGCAFVGAAVIDFSAIYRALALSARIVVEPSFSGHSYQLRCGAAPRGADRRRSPYQIIPCALLCGPAHVGGLTRQGATLLPRYSAGQALTRRPMAAAQRLGTHEPRLGEISKPLSLMALYLTPLRARNIRATAGQLDRPALHIEALLRTFHLCFSCY